MVDIKESNKDDELLLLPDVGTKKFTEFPKLDSKSAIMKGVVKQLEKWPSYLFFVFFIACVIIVNLVLLIIVSATLSLPTNTTNIGNRENFNKRSINVYSVKQEDRIWSMMDLCHIESAARENPELNIHLINLHKKNRKEDSTQDFIVTRKLEPEIRSVTNAIDLQNKATRSLWIMREARLRDQIAHKYENVKNHDITVDNFFQGTNLSKVAGNLNNKILKIATEAYFIWNSSGIALDPRLYCNLKYISQIICNSQRKQNEECVPDGLATIDPQNNIQAAGVPCQAFIGYFINDISKNESIRKEGALLKSINKFCPQIHSCNEVRILDKVKTCRLNILKCPIVHHHGFLLSALSYSYMLPHL
ncbi:uncharacterized protein LOC122631868 isoform X1 [Vespula pensylvanica]|uniref:uncharacterized protein LOC122631868 isoform X1 n=1 Tax=Vespula pensylvanica TaxID=30213 RepID=UPI001CBA2A53|nr:uncharacterized protein LOC122631868 isoform X1 [Vespula pensylvanica]